MDVLQRRSAAEFQQAWCDIDRQHLLFDRFGSIRRSQPRESHDLHDAHAGFMGRAFVDHAVFAIQQSVITHEDDYRVVQLASLTKQFVESPDAVING